MVMRWWWLTLLLLAIAIATWAGAYWNRRSVHRSPVMVANSEFLHQLPSYRSAERRDRCGRTALIVLAIGGVLGAAILSGRISLQQVSTPEFANRDIVLCLDVSGSMYQYDTEILSTFASMVPSFEGERIALSIFNSTSRIVFPLTNDYALVYEELSEGSEAINFDENGYRSGVRQYTAEQVQNYSQFIAGTQGIFGEASIVPDGLASCAGVFDQAEQERSRSIIFATDNEVNGTSIYTLQQAAAELEQRGITLYTFYPGARECDHACFDELKQVTEGVDGMLFQSTSPDAIPQIIQQVQASQAAQMQATPTITTRDLPGAGFLITLMATVGLILVGWWSRR